MDEIDDGSGKPIGYQTDDGELEVREVDGIRAYHETKLGQHMRWMRQAPDLFELYQPLAGEVAQLRLERDKWLNAFNQSEQFQTRRRNENSAG